MVKLNQQLKNCKHPNSRKTKALSKKANRQNKKHKLRQAHAIKSNLMGERLNWFVEHIDKEHASPLTPEHFENLIELYLGRFDEELDLIATKQSISKSRSNQHVARQNVIKITKDKEQNEYSSGGIELLNLCDPVQFKSLMDWDGNALSVQHMKIDFISQNLLQNLKKKKTQ